MNPQGRAYSTKADRVLRYECAPGFCSRAIVYRPNDNVWAKDVDVTPIDKNFTPAVPYPGDSTPIAQTTSTRQANRA